MSKNQNTAEAHVPEVLEKLHDKNLILEEDMLRLRRCRYGLISYPAQDMYVGRSLDVYGDYMPCEVNLFRHLIKPGGVVLDIGANIGAHTIAFASMVGTTGAVIAIEAQRYCYNILCANIALNNLHNVITFHNALGATTEAIKVPYIFAKASLNLGGIGKSLWDQAADSAKNQGETVKSIKLDSIGAAKCDFIKIDIEGMELEALQGGQNFIRRHRPIMFVEDDRGDKSQAVREMLWSLNYRIYYTYSKLFAADNFFNIAEDVFAVSPGCANLVCFPAETSMVCPEIPGMQIKEIPTP